MLTTPSEQNVELQYGAGWKSIAANNNLTEKQAKGFIERYYSRYSGLKAYQDSIQKYAEENSKLSSKRSSTGIPLSVCKYKSITGRIYTFTESESPDFMQERGIYTSFNPTQFKNYPMQGFATADIVPEVLGQLHKELCAYPNTVLMINTVHDSVLFDVKRSSLDSACTIIEHVMSAAPHYMEERYGINIDLPMAVDIEYGPNWMEMKRWKGL